MVFGVPHFKKYPHWSKIGIPVASRTVKYSRKLRADWPTRALPLSPFSFPGRGPRTQWNGVHYDQISPILRVKNMSNGIFKKIERRERFEKMERMKRSRFPQFTWQRRSWRKDLSKATCFERSWTQRKQRASWSLRALCHQFHSSSQQAESLHFIWPWISGFFCDC